MSFADWDRYAGNVSNAAIDFELFSAQNWGAPVQPAPGLDELSTVS